MGLLDKREYYKPFEYPEVFKYIEKINHSYWLHSEVNFNADLSGYKKLSDIEKSIITNTLLAIAQIEVSVKLFWGNLYEMFPKPEINGMGSSFAESEFRHSEAYSRLLEILGLEHSFETFLENAVIRNRFNYLVKSRNKDPQTFAKKIAIFSLVIENVSLFSQFLIILSFKKYKGLLTNVANQIQWTSFDEQTHADGGMFLVNKLFEEYPEIKTEEFIEKITTLAKEAFKHEQAVLDLIFEKGDLPFLKREVIEEFIKDRINQSFSGIGFEKPYKDLNKKLLEEVEWFDNYVFGNVKKDFFSGRPTEYTVGNIVIDENSLFEDEE